MSGPPVAVLHRAEREQLLETLRAVGPDAPTLCSPWTASTVAAHLVASEAGRGVPWAGALPLRVVLGARVTGALLQRLAPRFEQGTRRVEARGWPWLLERLDAGPPRLFRIDRIARIRLLEDWVHHEDVRRANGRGHRPSDPAFDALILDSMRAAATMPELAEPRRTLEARFPDGTIMRLSDEVKVRITGSPSEVVLFLAGRHQVADIEVDGAPDDVAAVTGSLSF